MYSQYDEEAAILAHTPAAGKFLDIGAWHPTQFSNTRALFERGWSGVMIEPSPEPFLALLKTYGNEPRITLICAAVGFERCMVKFHATADAVSTSSEEVYKQWKTAGGYYGSFYAPQFRLEELFNQFGGGFNFVNFDAEGISVDIARRFLELEQRPQCFCVEHDGRIVEISRRAQQAGYSAVLTNGTNIVFALLPA